MIEKDRAWFSALTHPNYGEDSLFERNRAA